MVTNICRRTKLNHYHGFQMAMGICLWFDTLGIFLCWWVVWLDIHELTFHTHSLSIVTDGCSKCFFLGGGRALRHVRSPKTRRTSHLTLDMVDRVLSASATDEIPKTWKYGFLTSPFYISRMSGIGLHSPDLCFGCIIFSCLCWIEDDIWWCVTSSELRRCKSRIIDGPA